MENNLNILRDFFSLITAIVLIVVVIGLVKNLKNN